MMSLNPSIDTVSYWKTGQCLFVLSVFVFVCVCMYVVYTSDYYLARTVYTKGTGRSEAHDMVTVTEFQIVRETIW